MKIKKSELQPRKMPIQARSTYSVEAIFEGTIQVLLAGGIQRLTTSKVAERAGVSVGTVYQYYANKQSLLAAVLEWHLLQVVEAVEATCARAKGRPLHQMVTSLVDAFIQAKMKRPNVSKALYAVGSELDGNDLVSRMTQRSQLSICDLLATAPDARFSDLKEASFVLSTALVGTIQALLAVDAPATSVDAVRAQLVLLVDSYLRRISSHFATD